MWKILQNFLGSKQGLSPTGDAAGSDRESRKGRRLLLLFPFESRCEEQIVRIHRLRVQEPTPAYRDFRARLCPIKDLSDTNTQYSKQILLGLV